MIQFATQICVNGDLNMKASNTEDLSVSDLLAQYIQSSCFAHYNDVIMSAMVPQITSLTIVYSTVYSGADQNNMKALRHWPLCGEFTGDRWIPRTNGQLRGKCLHLMTSSCMQSSCLAGEFCEQLACIKKALLLSENNFSMNTVISAFDLSSINVWHRIPR